MCVSESLLSLYVSLSGDRPRAHSAAYGMSFELSEDILIKTTRSGRGRRPLGSRFDGWSHQITKKTFPGGDFSTLSV